jgi:hypothetical protein
VKKRLLTASIETAGSNAMDCADCVAFERKNLGRLTTDLKTEGD